MTFSEYVQLQYERAQVNADLARSGLPPAYPDSFTPLGDPAVHNEYNIFAFEGSNVFLNFLNPGQGVGGDEDDKDPTTPAGQGELEETWYFECKPTCVVDGGLPGGYVDPPECAALTPDKVAKVRFRDFYFFLWPNSNAFAQTLLNMAGIDHDLPIGAVGDVGHGTEKKRDEE